MNHWWVGGWGGTALYDKTAAEALTLSHQAKGEHYASELCWGVPFDDIYYSGSTLVMLLRLFVLAIFPFANPHILWPKSAESGDNVLCCGEVGASESF